MLLPAVRPAAAQTVQRVAVADSVDLVRHARGAQREFERVRRVYLPGEYTGGGRCDERIGRFCYWYDPTISLPRGEAPNVGRAREGLLRDLTVASERLPGDDWLLGQRVRYLAEHGRVDSAVAAADRCQGTRWWCDALQGFSRHLAHDFAGADSAFARALAGMEPRQRCAWADLSPVLGGAARPYRARPCAEREALADSIWWLAHPLYSRPGNDLRTEHYARHTMALLLERAAVADGVAWGQDARELIVRFGWPTSWSRAVDQATVMQPAPVIGHEPSPSYWLFPTVIPADTSVDVAEVRWEPAVERPPSRYAPPYAAGFTPIDRAQFARFRRGDSTLTVAAFDLSADAVFATHPMDVRLAVAHDPATAPAVAQVTPFGPFGVAEVRSAWAPAVVSLEVVGTDTAWVARRRAVAADREASAISDLLFFAPEETLPDSLPIALHAALPGAVVRTGDELGVYWEMYGAADSAGAEIALTVTKARGGRDAVYPIGRPACAPPADSPVTLKWHEALHGSPGGDPRAVALDLRALSTGAYVVTLELSVAGVTRGCSSRHLRIVSRN